MKKSLIWMFFILFLLTSCSVTGSKSKEIQPVPETKSVVDGTQATGRLLNTKKKAVQGASIYLAQVYRQDGKAAFLLDSGNSPSAKTDKKGNFSINDVTAGEYVLVIGNPMSKYQILSNDKNEPVVFTIEGGKANDLGIIQTTILK